MVTPVRDYAVLAGLLLSFATLLTTHVAIAVRLGLRARPRYRGVVALLVPPLAPFWAYEQRWRTMVLLWVGAVAVYLVTRVLAAF
jgi:hypothetical protein